MKEEATSASDYGGKRDNGKESDVADETRNTNGGSEKIIRDRACGRVKGGKVVTPFPPRVACRPRA